MEWIFKRLAERSTWQGVVVLLSALGLTLAPEQKELIMTAGAALVGLILTFTADK